MSNRVDPDQKTFVTGKAGINGEVVLISGGLTSGSLVYNFGGLCGYYYIDVFMYPLL